MTDLDELQAFITTQMRSRKTLPNDASLARTAASLIKSGGELSPVERLEIYREQFWLRHTASLGEDFPGVSGILGQASWRRLIEDYLDAHPPTSFTLRDLGLQLPEYIAGRLELEPELRMLCTDMARLERGYIEIFDAADALPISPGAIAAVPEHAWARARLVTHPALRLLSLNYPVAELRRQLIEAKNDAGPRPQREPHCLLLFRDSQRDLQMFHERLSAGAHALLAALMNSRSLLAACEQAQAEVPGESSIIAENVGPWFESWAARGFITAVAL